MEPMTQPVVIAEPMGPYDDEIWMIWTMEIELAINAMARDLIARAWGWGVV